ncbi:MAG: ferrous iron transport protein B [Deferribacterales bacterium]|nr:ferrous iron transport protein B [Deferribacterales bacterium]
MEKKLVIALAGNPNSGKTTVFNNLTGARQHVGNYPGVTVERKEGSLKYKGIEMDVVDLPGTYSLTAYSAEEVVARNFIVDEKPDVVVDIIDSSNLERNLYLAVQLMELNIPLIFVFNMSDVAKSRGLEFDLQKLTQLFGVPIVPAVGSKNQGMNDILDKVLEVTSSKDKHQYAQVDYGKEVNAELDTITALVEKTGIKKYPARWLALKLLENDKDIKSHFNSEELDAQLQKSSDKIESLVGEIPETAIAGARYGFISGACQEAVRSTIEVRHTLSDAIDTVVANRVLGIPIFLGLMYLVFQLTFTIGDPFMGWIEEFFGWLGDKVSGFWPEGSESLLQSLIVDGIIGGVGGVIVFLPNILLLFLAIAFLEDSGYMARVAFIMDKLMHKIGLHGKSFIPLIIGFGCSVPAIMATRTLENQRDRLITMLVAPMMSCGARLPIYALIIPAFFPDSMNAPMLWTIYIIGIVVAIISAKLLGTTILKGESVPFVMELPLYRMPTLKGVLTHMWERGWLYLKKACTVILGISIVLWAMTTFPRPSEEVKAVFEAQRVSVEESAMTDGEKEEILANIDYVESEQALQNSIAGRVGKFIEPVLEPMGFDWKIGTALIGAFAAKEVFVAQMGIVYSVGEVDEESESLRAKLAENYSPLIGFCIMLFCLLSTPCMATFAVTKRESGSVKWAFFQLIGLTVIAYILTVIVFQVGTLFQIGVTL